MYAQSSLRMHHINYFNHIYDLFKPYISSELKVKERIWTDQRNNTTYNSVSFATLTLPCLTDYRQMFDSSNNKIVPLNIKELFTPVGLAYWILDDGSLQNKGLHLSVYGFTYNEVLLLKSTLEQMFYLHIL